MNNTIYFRYEDSKKIIFHLNNEEEKELTVDEKSTIEDSIIDKIELVPKKNDEDNLLRISVENRPISSNERWESLGVENKQPYSCSSDTTIFHNVQTVSKIEAIQRRKVNGAISLLVVGCSPESLPTLNIQDEFYEINSGLKKLIDEGYIEIHIEEISDFDSLIKVVREIRPDIFHFIGHTTETEWGDYTLSLKGKVGTVKGLGWNQLSDLLLTSGVQFAVLNACNSAVIANFLASKGLATIGMHDEIRDKLAKKFASGLYQALIQAKNLDEAVNEGRLYLYLEDKDGGSWSYPILFIPNEDVLGFKIKKELVSLSQVSIKCNSPKNATVFINDELQTKLTPLTVPLRFNYPYKIRLERENYESITKEFTAIDPKHNLTIDLEPIRGNLSVKTHPKIPNMTVQCQNKTNPRQIYDTTTDALGNAFFKDIPIGKYRILTSFELDDIVVDVKKETQTEALELNFPMEMYLSHGLASVGDRVIKWFSRPTSIIAIVFFIALIVGVLIFKNLSFDNRKAPKNMVFIAGTEKYTFLGTNIDEKNTPKLEDETYEEWEKRRKISQLIIDEIRNTVHASAVQRYWGEKPKMYSLSNDLYMDKTEVTVRDYKKFIDSMKSNKSLIQKYRHSLDKTLNEQTKRKEWNKKTVKDFEPSNWLTQLKCPNCPISNIDYYSAYAYASFVGKRLPTTKEWEIFARGKEGRIFPWGDEYTPWIFNGYSSEHKNAVDVGSFTESNTPEGLMDMAGNLDEWVLVKETDSEIETALMGGSVISRGLLDILTYGHMNFSPNNTSNSTGFRCISDSKPIEKSTVVHFQRGEYPIGGLKNYYSDIIRELESVIDGNTKKRFVGEEPLTIPIDKEKIGEFNYFEDGLKSFYIDKNEVTIEDYAVFLDAVRNNPTLREYVRPKGIATNLQILTYEPEKWEKQLNTTNKKKPVRYISWAMATSYCIWKDKRLPTIFEFEYLMGGDDENLYPNELYQWDIEKVRKTEKDKRHRMNVSDTTRGNVVNALDDEYKEDKLYHIFGNVSEWVDDPRFMTGATAYIKGGNFKMHGKLMNHRFYKYKLNKLVRNNEHIGFRCAKDY